MTSHRIAADVADIAIDSYQRAARTVLLHPLVTATVPTPDALALVRRWSAQLSRDLQEIAGYRLEVTPTCIRLVRRADDLDRTQGLSNHNGRRFDRRRYAYLALVLALLGRSGGQVTVSDLAIRLRAMAAEIDGLGFDPDNHAHRVALTDVLTWLERSAALRLVDSTGTSWSKDPSSGEALYDIDRDVCHLLFTPPRMLQPLRSCAELLEEPPRADSRDVRRAETRARLSRLLLERPVVYLDDLSPVERSYLRAEGRALAADLTRLTGAPIERRAEGLALLDVAGFSDVRFPGTGTLAQAALLLGERIVAGLGDDGRREAVRRPGAAEATATLVVELDAARPAGSSGGSLLDHVDAPFLEDNDRDDAATLPLVGDAEVLEHTTWLCARHGRFLKDSYRDDPARLATDAIALLESLALVRRVPGGLLALPALARYRQPTVVTEPTQSSFADLGLLATGAPTP